MSDPVVYEVVNGVAWLTINRPEARNALSAAVRAGLFAGVRRFNADDSARVLVLTGAGDRAFCAGGDLKEMADTALEVPPPDFLPQFGRNIDVAKPTIAAVNGVAYAGGFLLAQNCDLCVAAESARFAITEVKVGRGCAVGGAAAVADPAAHRDADPAHRRPDQRGPRPRGRAGQRGRARTLTCGPRRRPWPSGSRPTRRCRCWPPSGPPTCRRELPLAEAFEAAERIWAPVYRSDDAQEGPAAFRDKRRPVWTGR